MKISEVLNESAYDAIAHYHAISEPDFDCNPEANTFAEKNAERYKEYFRDFYESGVTPVFTKDVENEKTAMTVTPDDEEMSSAGHRGMMMARKRGKLD